MRSRYQVHAIFLMVLPFNDAEKAERRHLFLRRERCWAMDILYVLYIMEVLNYGYLLYILYILDILQYIKTFKRNCQVDSRV